MIDIIKADIDTIIGEFIEYEEDNDAKIEYVICSTKTYNLILESCSNEGELRINCNRKIGIIPNVHDFHFAICDDLDYGEVDFK